MHDPETHLIPLVLFAAMGRQKSVNVFGNDHPMPHAHAFGTMCMLATWLMRMWRHCNGLLQAIAATTSIWEMVTAFQLQRS